MGLAKLDKEIVLTGLEIIASIMTCSTLLITKMFATFFLNIIIHICYYFELYMVFLTHTHTTGSHAKPNHTAWPLFI